MSKADLVALFFVVFVIIGMFRILGIRWLWKKPADFDPVGYARNNPKNIYGITLVDPDPEHSPNQ